MKRELQAPCVTTSVTGMSHAILAEIAQRLQALLERNEPSSIDLRSLPMTQADREQLEQALGHGEVHVHLELAGPSDIWETAYAGVWWIRHRGANARIANEEIAVTRIPDILLSQPHDVAAAAARILRDLATGYENRPDFDPPANAGEPGLEASHV